MGHSPKLSLKYHITLYIIPQVYIFYNKYLTLQLGKKTTSEEAVFLGADKFRSIAIHYPVFLLNH